MPWAERLIPGLIITIVGGLAVLFLWRLFEAEVQAPNLLNRTLASATEIMERQGFEYSVATIPGINRDIVVSQHPPPGSSLARNEVLLLVIESGVDSRLVELSRAAGTLVERRMLIPAGTQLRFIVDKERVIGADSGQLNISATLANEVLVEGELIFARGASVLLTAASTSTFRKRNVTLRAFGVVLPSGQTQPVHTTTVDFSNTASIGTIVSAAVIGLFLGALIGLVLDFIMFFVTMGLFAKFGAVAGLIVGISFGVGNFNDEKVVRLSSTQPISVNLSSDQNVLLLQVAESE